MTISEQTKNRTVETIEKELAETRSVLATLEQEQKGLTAKKANALNAGEIEQAALSGKPLPRNVAKIEQGRWNIRR